MPKPVKLTAGVRRVKATTTATAPKARKRFEILAYTGGPLVVDGYDYPIYLDLDGLTTSSQRRPILYSHRSHRNGLVGQTDRITISPPNELRVAGFFLTSTPIAREVLAIAEDGFDWQASVGADPEEIEDVREGQTAMVNGREAVGPCYIARRATLGEVSFVVQGADDRTSARIVAKLARAGRRVKGNAMGFDAWVQSLGITLAALSADQVAQLRQAYATLPSAVAAEGEDDLEAEGEDDLEAEGEDDLEAEGEDDMEAEGEDDLEGEGEDDLEAEDDEPPVPARRARAAKAPRKPKVTAKARKVNSRRPPVRKVTAARLQKAREVLYMANLDKICAGRPKLHARALQEGWSLDKARLHVLRASRAPAPRPQSRRGEEHKVIQAALMMTGGIKAESVAKTYGEDTVNRAMEHDLRGISLHYVMDRTIEAAGDTFRGNRRSTSFIKAAMRANRRIKASAFSTLSLSTILEAVANKALIESYEAVETVWQTFCAVRTLNDFKPHNRYRLDAQGAFQKVSPDGELTHVKLSDQKYSLQGDTWGAIIALNRQMMINDDLSAFLTIPKMLGTMGAIAVEEAVMILLLSNAGNFFHANNRNVTSGAGSAFGIEGVTGLEEVFRNQVGPNNKPILASPQLMLVPTTLTVKADVLYTSATVNETTAAGKPSPVDNPHAGKYKPVSSPYLNNAAIQVLDEAGNAAAIAGQSSKAYYQFARPEVRAAVAVGFLNGIQQPTVENDDTDFDTLGLQYRSYLDFGAAFEDPTAAARAAGE